MINPTSSHRRPKLGQLLNSSPEHDDNNNGNNNIPISATASPYSSVESSPWSHPSPYINSPWSKLSPFHQITSPTNTTTTHTLIATLLREEGHVSSLACSHDTLYTGSESKTVRVWNKTQLSDSGGSFKSGTGSVKAIVISEAHNRVFTGHQDGKIRVWRREDHKRVGSLPTWREYVRSTVDPRKYVKVRRDKRVLGMITHFDAVSCLAVSEEAGVVYSGSWDKTVKVWRMTDLRCLESVAAHDDAVNAVAVGFGGLVFTGSADGTVKIWRRELDGGKVRHVYVQTLLDVQPNAVTSLAVSSDDGILYSGSSDGMVNFWEGKEQLSYGGALRGHKQAVLTLAAAGRRMILSGSADNTICVWRREPDGAHVWVDVLTGHSGPVKCLTVDRDGGGDDVDEDDDDGDAWWMVHSGSLDRSVKVWRVREDARAA